MKGICFHKTEAVASLLKNKFFTSAFLFQKTPSGNVLRVFNPNNSCSTDFFTTLWGVFGTLLSICNGGFLRKQRKTIGPIVYV